MIVTFDVETTTRNNGNPFTASNKMVSYAVKIDDRPCEFSYYTAIDYLTALRDGFSKAKLLVGFNIKFDLHWAKRNGIVPPEGCRVWDCQIAEFILRGQKGAYPSLNEALERFDLGAKDDKVAEYWKLGVDTTDIPADELRFYNILDVELTYKLYLKQQEVMTEKQKRLCLVQGLDLLVLAEMEWNGVKLDVDLCKQKADETEKELAAIAEQLREFCDSPYFNWDSGHHLSCLLYGGAFEVAVVDRVEPRVYQSGLRKGEAYEKTFWKLEQFQYTGMFTPLKGSQTKLKSKVGDKEYPIYASGADVLKQLRKPTNKHKRIIQLLLERAEKEKLLSTYYSALPELLKKMEWGDMLHGQYNQVVAATGRLSSSNPNMQNFSGDVDLLLVSRYV